MRGRTVQLGAVSLLVVLAACGGSNEPSASVKFDAPEDGTVVAGAVPLAMAADGVTIEPAGEERDGAGHFHVIADAGCVEVGSTIDNDADHLHFGNGQSDGLIYLSPGGHELCLQVGDGLHQATDITSRITVNVEVADQDEWCRVMDEVDDLIGALDVGDDFAAAQAGSVNASRLLAQLADADGVIDGDARADVEASLALRTEVSHAVTNATDRDDAVAALAEIFDGSDAQAGNVTAGEDWIEQTCGISSDG